MGVKKEGGKSAIDDLKTHQQGFTWMLFNNL